IDGQPAHPFAFGIANVAGTSADAPLHLFRRAGFILGVSVNSDRLCAVPS
ncbi:hypothetical protein X777_12052, partial [Ooceraea biroi]